MTTGTCAGCGKPIETKESIDWMLKLDSFPVLNAEGEMSKGVVLPPMKQPKCFHGFACLIVWAEKTPLAKMGRPIST